MGKPAKLASDAGENLSLRRSLRVRIICDSTAALFIALGLTIVEILF